MRLSERREKVGLLIVFLLGAITIIVSTARFAAIMMLSNDIMICKLNPFLRFLPPENTVLGDRKAKQYIRQITGVNIHVSKSRL